MILFEASSFSLTSRPPYLAVLLPPFKRLRKVSGEAEPTSWLRPLPATLCLAIPAGFKNVATVYVQ